MSYDASAQTLRCPFCASVRLDKQSDSRVLAPEWVMPFAVSHDRAVALMREWLGKGFWRPGNLAGAATIATMTPVYVPYWVFRATTHTYWTADSSRTPAGARGNWYPLSGEHRGQYSGVLVGASGVLTPTETWAICPFYLAARQKPDAVDTDNYVVERFSVQRKYARPQARQSLESLEASACHQYVPGKCRNMKVNVRLEGLAGEPVLLPVWVMAYRYKGRLFRFLLNGQSGKATGDAPVSYKKIIVAITIVVVIILLVFLGLIGTASAKESPRGNESPTAGAGVIPGTSGLDLQTWTMHGSRDNSATTTG